MGAVEGWQATARIAWSIRGGDECDGGSVERLAGSGAVRQLVESAWVVSIRAHDGVVFRVERERVDDVVVGIIAIRHEAAAKICVVGEKIELLKDVNAPLGAVLDEESRKVTPASLGADEISAGEPIPVPLGTVQSSTNTITDVAARRSVDLVVPDGVAIAIENAIVGSTRTVGIVVVVVAALRGNAAVRAVWRVMRARALAPERGVDSTFGVVSDSVRFGGRDRQVAALGEVASSAEAGRAERRVVVAVLLAPGGELGIRAPDVIGINGGIIVRISVKVHAVAALLRWAVGRVVVAVLVTVGAELITDSGTVVISKNKGRHGKKEQADKLHRE